MHPLDVTIIAAWLLFTLLAGVWFSRKAGESTESFFVSGRSLPWWAVGTSMVATTFAADTPLVVSGWVASKGIFENWIWWTFGLSGAVSVFLFARLWRRAHVVTDAELVELRYPGTAGTVLRGVKAGWFGVFMNLLTIAWVMKAMTKIALVTLSIPEAATVLGLPADVAVVLALFVLTVVYTASAGLWGVIATDLVQFGVAMFSAIALAVLAWVKVGGRAGMKAGFAEHGFDWERTTALIPPMDAVTDPSSDAAKFLVLVGMIWWGQKNIDGGGYLAQRLFAAKDDRHALWAYLWFTVAHIALRPWPWVVVGLAGMALIGPVEDPETYYPLMMKMLPPGLFGLMLASFLAAFMSTIDTQLNWGASLVVNDLYGRFLAPGASEQQLVKASRICIVGLALLGALVSFGIDDIGFVWKLVISVTAGVGTVYAARWYWWRVTAWCELAAMLWAGLATGAMALVPQDAAPTTLLLTAFPWNAVLIGVLSIPIWVAVAFATSDASDPSQRAHLRTFYERVRPGGPGWAAIAGDIDGFAQDGPGWFTVVGIVCTSGAIYGVLLGVGGLIVGSSSAPLWLGLGAVSTVGATWAVRRASL